MTKLHPFLQKLGLSTPIIQAPMAGASDANFVTAACELGMLGSLGAGMMSAAQISEQISAIKAATESAFMVNLMVLEKSATDKLAAPMPEWLSQLYHTLGVAPTVDERPAHDFSEQLAVLYSHPVPVASFSFGIIDKAAVDKLHALGTLVIGTANHPDEVLAWAAVGADAVIVQGLEAGGHRGGWLYADAKPLSLMDLLSLSITALDEKGLDVPLIAAGGIATATDVSRCLSAGAAAVSIGTVLLTTDESVISPIWQARLLAAEGSDTAFTRLYSGKWARGIITDYMKDFSQYDSENSTDTTNELPPYPTLNAMTKPLRAHGAKTENSELMSLWAGVGVGHCQRMSMADLLLKISPS